MPRQEYRAAASMMKKTPAACSVAEMASMIRLIRLDKSANDDSRKFTMVKADSRAGDLMTMPKPTSVMAASCPCERLFPKINRVDSAVNICPMDERRILLKEAPHMVNPVQKET